MRKISSVSETYWSVPVKRRERLLREMEEKHYSVYLKRLLSVKRNEMKSYWLNVSKKYMREISWPMSDRSLTTMYSFNAVTSKCEIWLSRENLIPPEVQGYAWRESCLPSVCRRNALRMPSIPCCRVWQREAQWLSFSALMTGGEEVGI